MHRSSEEYPSGLRRPLLRWGVFLCLAACLQAPDALAQHAAFPTAVGAEPVEPIPSIDERLSPDEDDDWDREPDVRERTAEDDERLRREEVQPARLIDPAEPAGGRDLVMEVLPSFPVIREVEVVGAQGEDHTKAMRLVRGRVGEPLDMEKQREDIRRLYESGLFRPMINVEAIDVDGGVKLRYVVEPNPKVNSITVSGNSKVSAKKILSELPVKEGEVYTAQAQARIRESVSRYYSELGYHDAVVRLEERIAPGNSVDLVLSVDEGTRMKIRDVIFRGNENIRDLAMQLRMENKGSWGPMKRYFNESRFQEDLNKIRALYVARGYLDAEVRRGDFIYAPDQSWVDPVIEITEGPRYRIGRLDARGYMLFSREEILEPFRGLQGSYYSLEKFQKAAVKVKNMYGDEGFLSAEVEPDFHKDPSRGVVDVDVEVVEGPRVYVGDVKIVSETYPEDEDMGWLRRFYSRFSPPVKDEVIQREVRLRPGQVYRRFDEVRTREQLKALNVFEDVQVGDQLGDRSNVRDAVIQVTQGNTGNLIFGVGFGDVEGGFFYANYIERNLFGMARDLRLSGLFGTRALNFEASYLDRYFLGTDIDAQFTLFRREFTRTGNFVQESTGATAEFARPLSDTLRDAIRFRLEAISFDLGGKRRPRTDMDDYLAATIRYRLLHDTRDDTFFPTSGHLAAASFEGGVADGLLLKIEGQYATYVQLTDDWVYSVNGLVGLMPYNADQVGYAERLFLGGNQDLRGFKLYGAGPHDPENSTIPWGGASKILVQQELRYRVTDDLVGVAFLDVGTLSDRLLSIETPRASVGVGARLRLPVAQVAVDLAVPVISQSEDQTQIFHFSLNSTF